ncbi:uncharacterized protein LOC110919734 [Helianthus annuus]|uniref:uncharacterized protein LOC110919734 n=1 Tax=Helianthus annuus TaxID=4232 RepID=UPI000B8EF1A0|nr:uncharacterized protein LOC110919734 [Helianthus annuus]
MADDIPPLFILFDISEDDESFSSDSSLLFFQNLIKEAAALEDTGTSRKRKYVLRDREKGHKTIMADYFVEEPKFNEEVFRYRFRMSKRLFLKIVSDVQAINSWFQEGVDARMKKCFTPMQKVTSAIKQLAIGNPPYENDEYLNMAERTSRDCLDNFFQTCGYYLTDGIYPTWSVFVKSFTYPHIVKEKKFNRQHEAARKDIERAFGVLKAKWGVLNRPMRAMSLKKIRNVVYACIIMHNMILKDDEDAIAPVHIQDPPVEPVFEDTVYNELINEDTHYRLKYHLVEHLGEQDLPHLLADSDDE